MLAKRDGAVYKISPLQLPLSRRNSNEFSSQKLLLIADGFSEHNRLEISALESKCVEHNNDAFSSTVECYESYESAENWLVGFAVMLFAVIDSFGPPVWLIRSV